MNLQINDQIKSVMHRRDTMLNSSTEENNIRPYDFNMLNDHALEQLDTSKMRLS